MSMVVELEDVLIGICKSIRIQSNSVEIMVRELIIDSANRARTDITHGYADGLGTVCNDDTPAPKTNEQRLDDLRSDRVVLC